MSSISNHYDITVIGLGAMGSAALYQLTEKSAKKLKVLGIEQYLPPHTYGSSHGESRFTRLSAGEFAEYTLTAKRSHELWSIIESKTKGNFGKLHYQTGGLIIGSRHKKQSFLQHTIASAKHNGIEYRILNANELRNTYPQFKQIDDELIGYYEKDMGILAPEACILAQLALAKDNGADIHTEEKLLRFERTNAGTLRLYTDKGEYTTNKLILSVGAWVAKFLAPKQAELFKISRQVFYWFQVEQSASAKFQIGQLPPMIRFLENERLFYALPGHGDLIKLACEDAVEDSTTSITNLTPEQVVRTVSKQEQEIFYQHYVASYFRGVSPHCDHAKVCLYTCTPNLRFLIDFLPGYDECVIVASPCSGRGFKHSAAIGEALATRILGIDNPIDVIRLFGGWEIQAPLA